MRLDIYLVEYGFESTRNRAKNLINDGAVCVNGKVITKPSYEVSNEDNVTIIGARLKYVSRGGLKLEKALLEFAIDVKDSTCLDIGASTGGFTDCLLQSGAKFVYAVDVGTSQLDAKISSDKRVCVLENTDARSLSSDIIKNICDLATFDVSFISLTKVVESVLPFIKESGKIIVLIKPQFEAGKEHLSKNGIVKSDKARKQVIENLSEYFNSISLNVMGYTTSPITGGDGNIEYLMLLEKRS